MTKTELPQRTAELDDDVAVEMSRHRGLIVSVRCPDCHGHGWWTPMKDIADFDLWLREERGRGLCGDCRRDRA